MSNPLHQYKVLLADADRPLSVVVKSTLENMGFSDIHITYSGEQAMEMLAQAHFDFLITEWNIKHLNGIDLIRKIRVDKNSPNPALPIIMLTGRAEQADVVVARDSGINEYIVKPFSARSIYNRLERIIEQPRHFIAAREFIGPDRRHKGIPPQGKPERRTAQVKAQPLPAVAAGKLIAAATPQVWLPDYSLKTKLGPGVTLPSIITPAVLNLAQITIDSITTESLQWIKQNLIDLKKQFTILKQGDHSPALLEEISETILTIRSRAGTFGYTRASEVAYMLYLFCRNHFKPQEAIHRVIVEKHIEVLQVMLGNDVRSSNNAESGLIIDELRKLAAKYAG
jgi:two-component system chemotaxis response regulator CheY